MNGQDQIATLLLAGMIAQGGGTSGAETARIVGGPDARPEIVHMNEQACEFITKHVPDDDVAYQPGVDVHGDPVVSADLNAPQYDLRPVYQFDVEIAPKTLNKKFKQTTGMPVATITYEPQAGRVLLDGQELVWLHENALAKACARR